MYIEKKRLPFLPGKRYAECVATDTHLRMYVEKTRPVKDGLVLSYNKAVELELPVSGNTHVYEFTEPVEINGVYIDDSYLFIGGQQHEYYDRSNVVLVLGSERIELSPKDWRALRQAIDYMFIKQGDIT